MVIRNIEKPELEKLVSLLTKNKLPVEDIGRQNQIFWGKWRNTELIGGIGLEEYGQSAILRSLVVDEHFRNHQLAHALYSELIDYAADKGIKNLYLLTQTAVGYFTKKGWQQTDREQVPQEIKASGEFANLCPASAVCMQISTKQAQAAILFKDGFNCAQSVLVPFAQQAGLDRQTALSLATGFGSGMVYRAETCGAITGSMLAIGLFTGRTKAADTDARDFTYMLINKLISQFSSEHGGIVCKNLLNLQDNSAESWGNAESAGVFENKCPIFVGRATAIVEELIEAYVSNKQA